MGNLDVWSMKWKAIKCGRLTECLGGRPGVVLLLLPCALLFSLYINSRSDFEYGDLQYPSSKSYNDGIPEGYLVWNPKCHMLSKSPLDPSITKFVKKEKFESCSNGPPLTRVSRDTNGSAILVFDEKVAKTHRGLSCCWTAVYRPTPPIPPGRKFDSIIAMKDCESFDSDVILPRDVQVLLVTCKGKRKTGKAGNMIVYENVHPVIQTEKIHERLDRNETLGNETRKLSVLLLGIDSVSRLNFQRTMPKTEKHLRDSGWTALKGYNKMGENTFPNLMAILTGQNQEQAYSRCKPTEPYNLDACPFLWHNFRNAGYVTAYGEDDVVLSTFNYLKVGFIQSPTDYYLRPYVLAFEKLLKSRKRFSSKYCTGPELTFDRIFDYAIEFARTFLGVPYFGFFWTNSVSHDNMNGPSSVDEQMLKKLELLEKSGVMNDTMIVFLSDHGMRYGSIRETFVGWYEERLPFLYIWLPHWYRAERPQEYQALRINENRLSSPYDLHETFREILLTYGGFSNGSSLGCPTCQSLFSPLPLERGCSDAGVAPHWCTCTAFEPQDPSDEIVQEGARRFLSHIEDIVKVYKDRRGKRLCAKFKLKRIHRVKRVIDLDNSELSNGGQRILQYFYMLQVSPGDGKFEVTVQYHGNGNYTISDHQIGRIDSYASSAKCLDHGSKQYCHCVK